MYCLTLHFFKLPEFILQNWVALIKEIKNNTINFDSIIEILTTKINLLIENNSISLVLSFKIFLILLFILLHIYFLIVSNKYKKYPDFFNNLPNDIEHMKSGFWIGSKFKKFKALGFISYFNNRRKNKEEVLKVIDREKQIVNDEIKAFNGDYSVCYIMKNDPTYLETWPLNSIRNLLPHRFRTSISSFSFSSTESSVPSVGNPNNSTGSVNSIKKNHFNSTPELTSSSNLESSSIKTQSLNFYKNNNSSFATTITADLPNELFDSPNVSEESLISDIVVATPSEANASNTRLNDLESINDSNESINNSLLTNNRNQSINNSLITNDSNESINNNNDPTNSTSLIFGEELVVLFDSLSAFAQTIFIFVMLKAVLISALFNLIFIFYGNFILNKFNLENKFPKLAKYIKMRTTFVRYIVFYNCLCFILAFFDGMEIFMDFLI